ncbi:MAG: stage III sporulation protein AE, partial [Eubacterium sp.]|nr:stage III sporulation protein AE [Eubacterium sp.]
AAQTPIEACIAIFLFIIISSFFQNLKSTMINDEMSSVFSTVSALVIAVVLAVKMKTTISLACTAISVCADFVFAFIPVFCIIVAASGNTVAAFSTNTMLLSLAQTLNYVSKNIFVPITNCFLAIGICSGLRSELNLSSLLAFLKKYITTAISMAAAGFVSVLSIKTAVAVRADAIGLRSIRFAINSVVPVIGGAISEGLLSIQSYSSLIRSSVGVVGIIAVALVFMPAIIEVVLWRFFLSLSCLVSDVFGDKSVSLVLKAFADAMLIMNVILILSMVTTIISIGILIAAKGSS